MSDQFANQSPGLNSPASDMFDITPSDSTVFAQTTRALHCKTTPGIARVVTAAGTTIDIYLSLGCVFPVRANKVLLTGTTAAGIVGMF